MEGFVDIHVHVLPGVDDGPATVGDAAAIASGLRGMGFTCLIATPHARPGLFDPDDAAVLGALRTLREALGAAGPRILPGGEHFLDDVVWMRIAEGKARPYPNGKAILVEIPTAGPAPARLAEQLFRLRVSGLRPVLAHPERCASLQADRGLVEELHNAGVAMAMDLTSITGTAGRAARRAADDMLGMDMVDVACSDAHSPHELPGIEKALARLRKLCGDAALDRMLHEAPIRIALGEAAAAGVIGCG
ncbi:MAG: protein tyrosine phosphatase [Myxococcota bacterium]|nr:protein tyrosine phosphatase [Myxococcota bacterium]